jgi:hypothetical protein
MGHQATTNDAARKNCRAERRCYGLTLQPDIAGCVLVDRPFSCGPTYSGSTSARRRPINGGPLRQFNVGPGSAILRRSTLSHESSTILRFDANTNAYENDGCPAVFARKTHA